MVKLKTDFKSKAFVGKNVQSKREPKSEIISVKTKFKVIKKRQ